MHFEAKKVSFLRNFVEGEKRRNTRSTLESMGEPTSAIQKNMAHIWCSCITTARGLKTRHVSNRPFILSSYYRSNSSIHLTMHSDSKFISVSVLRTHHSRSACKKSPKSEQLSRCCFWCKMWMTRYFAPSTSARVLESYSRYSNCRAQG